MKKIVGIAGKKGSGKDTVASYLCKKYGFYKIALADPVKAGVAAFFGWSLIDVYNKKEEIDSFWKIKIRKPLQVLATEVFRERLGEFFPELGWVGENFWVLRWIKEYKNKKLERVVIPDIRFVNEIEEFRKRFNFYVIRVIRDLGSDEDTHRSETELDNYDKFDFVLENNGTFEELYNKVDEIMEKVL